MQEGGRDDVGAKLLNERLPNWGAIKITNEKENWYISLRKEENSYNLILVAVSLKLYQLSFAFWQNNKHRVT